MIPNALTGLIFPKFAEKNIKQIHAGMKSKIFRLLIMFSSITLIYILTAPLIYRTFYPQYTDAIFYSQIFSLSLIAMATTPISILISAKKKTKYLYRLSIVTSIIQLIILIPMIIWQGILGLIITRVIIRFFSSIYQLFLYKKIINEERQKGNFI